MKKFTFVCTALAVLMLTSCKEHRDGDVTGVSGETTSLTLTVSLTEPEPPPEPEVLKTIELAVFDPFANAVKVDNTVKKELLDFAGNMETARQILSADWKIYNSDDYTDLENIAEHPENSDFDYKPFINTDIARNEEELCEYLRNYFTENYISDEEIREYLFTEKNTLFGFQPYKTIDGQLCIRSGYEGVMTKISSDDIWAMSYNGNYAEVVMVAHGVDYPPQHAFIGLERSEQYGWRVDSLEFKDYDERFIGIYITGFMEKYDALNKILGGGNVPENGGEITENGIKYVQTGLDMSIEEMREFFTDTFRSLTVTLDGRRSKLLEPYTEKYIDSVYFEKDGVLYRRADAPKWYLPENVFDPYNGYISGGEGSGKGEYIVKENFYDDITGESFTQKIALSYDYSWIDDEKEGIIYKYHGIYIVSELPIRERESGEMFDEMIKPVIDRKREELDLSDAPFGVTDIYSSTMFDYNNDGHNDYVIAYGLYAQFQLVIIDSQNGEILFDERIMTHLRPSTELEIYRNKNSEYAFKITFRNEKPVVSSIDETIQIITASEECIFEAVYDYETGNFVKGYACYDADNEYTWQEYIQKQEELLSGYRHYANAEWGNYS